MVITMAIIEIDGLPNLNMGGFSMAMLGHNQMVPSSKLTWRTGKSPCLIGI